MPGTGRLSGRATLAATTLLLTANAHAQGEAPHTDTANPPLTVTTTVPAARNAVWKAWTTDAGLRSFLSPHARVEHSRAVDAADARRVMEADPAVRAGVFKATLLPFEHSF